MKPPECIDGARVIAWAWSDIPFGVLPYPDGSVAAIIHGLAICQYEGASTFYRFSCNAQWECEQDQVCESLERAQQEVPTQYGQAKAVWHRCP